MAKSPDIDEYHDMLQIDPVRLDDHLIEQPSIFHSVCDAYAVEQSVRDRAKEDVKLIYSELYLSIKKRMDKRGRKMTEAALEAEIRSHPKHAEVVNWLLEVDGNLARWGALKDAFAQRQYMLRDMVGLHVTGYFVDSSVSDRQVYGERRRALGRERLARGRERLGGKKKSGKGKSKRKERS